MLNHEARWPPFNQAVVEARYAGGYKIWLRFDDGIEGEVDFDGELWGPAFEPLTDIEYFKRFFIDFDSLAWPNGADVCPSVLYATVVEGVPSTRPV